MGRKVREREEYKIGEEEKEGGEGDKKRGIEEDGDE